MIKNTMSDVFMITEEPGLLALPELGCILWIKHEDPGESVGTEYESVGQNGNGHWMLLNFRTLPAQQTGLSELIIIVK